MSYLAEVMLRALFAVRGPTLALALTPFVLLASACSHRPAQPVGEAALVLITELQGTLAPCGCTSRPLGGLDRIAQRVAEEANSRATLTLTSGNTFFHADASLPSMRGQAQAAANTIAQVLVGMGPLALGHGELDDAQVADANNLPPELKRLWPSAAAPLPVNTLTVGGMAIGVVAARTHEGALPSAAAVDQAAAAARSGGAEGIVLLWPASRADAQRALSQLSQVDLIVAGGDGPPQPPQALGTGTLVDAGARGEYIGLVKVSRGMGGRWQLFDGGAQALNDARARIERLTREAKALAEGPARTAREERARKLLAELPSLHQARPETALLTYEALPMDVQLKRAAWATQSLEHYNQALCGIVERDTARRTCAPAPSEGAQYVGSAACQSCHPQAWAVYKRSQHSRAWATLTSAHKQCDLTCVGCHVVGFEQSGGFCHLADAPKWANVGCESCHGPGKGHVQNPYERSGWAKNFVRDTPEATCRGCHNATHSDQFDFATYRPRILGPGHGLPPELH